MPWPNLTVQDVLDARKRLPARDPNTRPVHYPDGEVVFDIPTSRIASFVIAGFVEWDAERHTLHLTPLAEQELRQHGY